MRYFTDSLTCKEHIQWTIIEFPLFWSRFQLELLMQGKGGIMCLTIFFILVTQLQILISGCELHSARLVERNLNLSPDWGFPTSPQDCVTLLDLVQC